MSVSQSLRLPERAARRPRRRRVVFLGCPYGQVGGGMGSIMKYLLDIGGDPHGRYAFRALDSRGPGSVFFSPCYVAWGLLRIAAGRMTGRLAAVHLNLAERASVLRKGILLFGCKALGVPVVLHLHAAELIAFYRRLPAPARYLVRQMFRRADACLVLGELWHRWVTEELGVPRTRVRVVHNGIPDFGVRRPERASPGPFRVLFLGNLLQRKGLADLLAALASPGLAQASWSLTVAGGGAIDTYRSMAEQFAIADRVHFTGWVDQREAREHLAASDVLVLPSYDEGLPLVILEALATGVPVICSPVGAIPEVFEHGRTALLVQAGDIPGLAGALRLLADDAALQQRLAKAGTALYRQRFTMERFVARIAEVYSAIGDEPTVALSGGVPAEER